MKHEYTKPEAVKVSFELTNAIANGPGVSWESQFEWPVSNTSENSVF